MVKQKDVTMTLSAEDDARTHLPGRCGSDSGQRMMLGPIFWEGVTMTLSAEDDARTHRPGF